MAEKFLPPLLRPAIQTFLYARRPQGRLRHPLPARRLAHALGRRRGAVARGAGIKAAATKKSGGTSYILPHHAAGAAVGDASGGDVARYETARADDASVADGDAGQDDRAAAYPDVRADRYRRGTGDGEFKTVDNMLFLPTRFRRHWMKGSIYLHIGGDQCVVTYRYPVVVKEGAVHIDKAVFAEKDISSDIGIKGRTDAEPLPAASEKLREQGISPLFFTVRRSVEFQQQFRATAYPRHQWISSIISRAVFTHRQFPRS